MWSSYVRKTNRTILWWSFALKGWSPKPFSMRLSAMEFKSPTEMVSMRPRSFSWRTRIWWLNGWMIIWSISKELLFLSRTKSEKRLGQENFPSCIRQRKRRLANYTPSKSLNLSNWMMSPETSLRNSFLTLVMRALWCRYFNTPSLLV